MRTWLGSQLSLVEFSAGRELTQRLSKALERSAQDNMSPGGPQRWCGATVDGKAASEREGDVGPSAPQGLSVCDIIRWRQRRNQAPAVREPRRHGMKVLHTAQRPARGVRPAQLGTARAVRPAVVSPRLVKVRSGGSESDVGESEAP